MDVFESGNGRSKGCGIAEFATYEQAQHAVQTLQDTELHNRAIFLREDRETESFKGTSGGAAAGGASASYSRPAPR